MKPTVFAPGLAAELLSGGTASEREAAVRKATGTENDGLVLELGSDGRIWASRGSKRVSVRVRRCFPWSASPIRACDTSRSKRCAASRGRTSAAVARRGGAGRAAF